MERSFVSLPTLTPHNPALDNLSPRDRYLFCKYAAGPSCHPSATTISAALSQILHQFPHHVAATLVNPDGSLNHESSITYAQLDSHSDRLAALLRTHGVSNNHPVCVFLTRGIPMLVAIVAILKVGACYVPQHVGVAPAEQLRRVAMVTKTKVVLTLQDLLPRLPNFDAAGLSVIPVDSFMKKPDSDVTGLAFRGPERLIKPSDRCYIIFTSGTTGKPKGVQVTQGNVANIILTHPMNLGLSPGKRIAQILSIAFDMGAWEILGSLTHGSTLLIRGRDISAAVKHAHVIIATPTVLGMIDASQMRHVETVAVAGEPCPRSLAETWGKFCTFYNSCGPTEVTIVNTAKKFNPTESTLTIGTPTPNNTVYILHAESGAPCKIGEVGEMWGGGVCVSQGYLDNDELTNERYQVDPFVQDGGNNRGSNDDDDDNNNNKWRMYKTGDLGRWNESGELEHFGRVDDQVKVKGFRVELDGISSVVESTHGVGKAVVLKVDDHLVAWVTPQAVDPQEVIATVSNSLPYYCVPSTVITLDKLPKTCNGKTDKRRLTSSLSSRTPPLRLTPTCSSRKSQSQSQSEPEPEPESEPQTQSHHNHIAEAKSKSKLPFKHLWLPQVCKVADGNKSRLQPCQ